MMAPRGERQRRKSSNYNFCDIDYYGSLRFAEVPVSQRHKQLQLKAKKKILKKMMFVIIK